MRSFAWLTILGYLALAPSFLLAQAGGELREWTDASGRKIVAALEGFPDAKSVRLRLSDGRSVAFPVDKLSAADRAFVQESLARGAKNPAETAIDWETPKESEKFVIRGVQRGNPPGYIYTKVGWEHGVDCILTKVQFKGPESDAAGSIHAYFYNADGKLLERFDGPPRRQDIGGNYIDVPKRFEKGELLEVYFPITAFLKETNWKTALVVFGTGADCSVEAFPKRSFKDLDFAEKRVVFPNWKPEEKAATPEMKSIELEIRRMQRETFAKEIVFNGGYTTNKPCVSAEVRAQGEFSPQSATVKLHVFDQDGKLVVTRNAPSTARTGAFTYSDRPQIAEERWYPVYFSLDGTLEGKDYPTYVFVFQFGGKTVASVLSSEKATLEKLEFPEKKEIAPPPASN